VLIFAAGGFAIGYLLIALLFLGGSSRDAVVAVPDLYGQTEAKARETLRDAGLKLEKGEALVHPSVPAGSVLAQYPLPGQEIAPGSEVRVNLSAGPDRLAVPDVRSLGEERAKVVLERIGFTVEVETRQSPYAAGRILAVEPEPGTVVTLPATVKLVVSEGPPNVAVPGIIGRSRDDAAAALEALGLRIGEIRYEPYSLHPFGEVLSQSPAAGDSIRQGSAVQITVAGVPPLPAPGKEEAAEGQSVGMMR
jgi:serine/threonine-protein kinase